MACNRSMHDSVFNPSRKFSANNSASLFLNGLNIPINGFFLGLPGGPYLKSTGGPNAPTQLVVIKINAIATIKTVAATVAIVRLLRFMQSCNMVAFDNYLPGTGGGAGLGSPGRRLTIGLTLPKPTIYKPALIYPLALP
jgi:hypothetical protein